MCEFGSASHQEGNVFLQKDVLILLSFLPENVSVLICGEKLMVDYCLFFLSQGFVTFDSCEAAEKAIDEVCMDS